MARHALFLSIQPRYARRIMEGKKTVELRRVRPRISKGKILLLYVSSPVKSLQAISTVENITAAPPDELWPQVALDAGVTQTEFYEYFNGAHTGFAIRLGEVQQFSRPLTLSELRDIWPGFNPPQIYHYFTRREFVTLLNIVEGGHSNDAVALSEYFVGKRSGVPEF